MFEDIIAAAKEDVGTANSSLENSVNEVSIVHRVTESKNEDVEDDLGVRISVLGVGGAGCNSVNRLMKSGIKSANCIALNTDAKHLNIIESHKKHLIGKKITRGLGAGGHPEVARKAAESECDLLKKVIGENELVFLCAGMGGGTGTGASPVIARLAKEQGAIVVAIVTYPFALERVRLKRAQEGINQLVKIADTVIVIDNNRLATYVPNLPVDKAFALADSIVVRAVKGLADTIMFPSLMNVDYADVKTVMQSGGLSMISLGEGSGMEKIEKVVKDTLEHPLLDVSYENAKGCLLHLEGGADLTLGDSIKIGEKITENFDSMANIKIGARVNPDLRDKVYATAIITGVKSPYMMGTADDENEDNLVSTEQHIEYM